MTKASNNFVETGSWGAFGLVVGINAAIAFAILIVFWIMRAHFRKTKYFFAPQYYKQKNTTDELPDPGTGLFSWVLPVLRFSDGDMLRMRGVDATLYLRLHKMMMIIFAAFIVLGVGVLIAVNYTAPNNFDGSEEENIRGLPQISMANIMNRSDRLWVHAVFAWIFSFFVFYLTYRFWREDYSRLRLSYMSTDAAHNYTVMYRGQAPLRSNPSEFFRGKYPGEVVDVQFGVHANELRKITEEWKDVNKKLYFANLALQRNGVRPTHKLKPIFGDKVDSINFYSAHLEELTKIIERERGILRENNPLTHAGFVTFNSINNAYQHALQDQKVKTPENYAFNARPAPEESDVYWSLLSKSPYHRKIFSPIVYAIVFFLIFFWGAITVFVQGIANLKNLAGIKVFSFLNVVLGWNPALSGLVLSFLPPLVLQILFSLVPKILQELVKLRGAYTQSGLQRSVTKMYFLFLIINVFLVSLFTGGAFFVLYQMISDSSVSSDLMLLGQGVPAQATFFINFVIVYAILTNTLKLLNPGPLIITLLKSYKAKTPEEEHYVQKSKPFQYERMYAYHLLFFTLGYTYSTIAPFILPWVLLYFCTSFLVGKYQLMYAQKPEYDSGGLMWPSVFTRLMAVMILSDLIMIGVFILKQKAAWAIMIPLLIITIIFAIYMHKSFGKTTQYLPADVKAGSGVSGQYIGAYVDPVFRMDFEAERADPLQDTDKPKPDIQDPFARSRPVAGYGSV